MSGEKQVTTREADDGRLNAAEHEIPSLNPKSAQKVHRGKITFPKTAAGYWMGKVKKVPGSGLYSVQIAHRKARHRFPLGTANKEAAAEKARGIYLSLVANGADATLAERKPAAKVKPSSDKVTVGQLIEAATRLSSARKESMDTYAKALRRITAGVIGADGKNKRKSVDSAPLTALSPSRVLAWRNAFLKAAKTPQERSAAAVTINSLMRNSKALLSKKIRPFLERELPLPSALWFEGIPMEKEGSLRYRSQIDAKAILQSANDTLAAESPEVYKALLLTLVCGLRRSEADAVEWAQIDFKAGTLEIRDNDARALKSADSAGVVGLDPKIVQILTELKGKTKSPHVLETPKLARKKFGTHQSRTYRCDATHNALITWLRGQGVPGIRPIHTLRKEIGSVIASRDGIFAASRFLRHSDIRITSRLYADNKTLITAGI